MLSQGPAVHCIVMGRDSGHKHFQGGGWQPTLQPFLQERKHYSNRASSGVFSARRTPVREQTPLQYIGLPCRRSSSLSDGLYHRLWETTQVCRVPSRSHTWRFHRSGRGCQWCRAPEKGSPSSEEWAREGLSRGEWVRETRSGWARTARPAGPAPRPPWLCTVSVRAGSLGEMHTCIEPEASCGQPRSGRKTTGSGRTREKQTGPPELLRIDSKSAGSSRDGVAILRGKWAVVRARRPHDWAPPECGQRAAIWAACDSRGGDGGRAVTCGVIVYPPTRLIYDTAAVLSVRTNTCLPNSSGRNCRKARCTASSSRQLMCQSSRGPVQSPEAACPLHVAPQPVLEASVVTTTCRDTCSKGTPARRKARSVQGLKERRHSCVMFTRSAPRRHAHLGTRECNQCWSGLIWSNPSGVTVAADAICPRSLWNCFSGTTVLPPKELRQFSTDWARSSVRRAVILTESNSTPRKEILCAGESLLFSQLTWSPNWLRCRSTRSLWSHNCSRVRAMLETVEDPDAHFP